ncbi:tautomerase family protein [Sedimenticola sp.]|uniref:tautomerase family protein n=1 Tax=Sedimenticola sp. TaxID=1940285 RepID=UPI0025834DCC|nr:tautomerase family protein [Sedimenticola sp.]MCW8903632.1 tautomerase family protein [Sedimenticola sp.]
MPIVTITLRAGRPASEIRAIMDAVHNATVNAFDVPETSRNQRLVEIAPEYLFYPQGRSEDFLTVEIASFPGRPPEQKAALFQQITTNLQQAADIAPGDVMILIHEPPKQNWGINGRPASQHKPRV